MLRKLSIALASLLVLSACVQHTSPDVPESVPPTSSSSVSEPESQPEQPVSAALTLEDWWSDYLYDAVYPFQSGYDFENPIVVSSTIVEYCATQLLRDSAPEKPHLSEDGFDKAQIADYVMRYFHVGLDALDLLNNESDDGKTLHFRLNYDVTKKSTTSLSNGTFTLTGQTENPDGTVALEVTRDDGVLTTFTMAPNGQGGWYFQKIHVDFTAGKTPEQLASVKLTGTYQTAKELNGWDSRQGSGRSWRRGELGGKILLANVPNQYSLRSILRMSLVNMTDLSEVKAEFQLEKGEYCNSLRANGTKIIAQTNRRILTWGPDFSDPQSADYPNAFKALYPEKVPQMDFSFDGKLAAYTNEKGLVLFDLESGKETLLAEHPDADGSGKILDFVSFGAPDFLPGDRRISARIFGYECTLGIFVYDLDTKSGKTLDATYGWDGLDLIAGNKIIAFQTGEDGNTNYCLDLDTGDKTEFRLPPEIKQVLPASSGDALLVLGWQEDLWQLYRMDLDTLELKKQDFTFQAADTEPQIIGVSESGAILLNYYSLETGSGEYILIQSY